MKIYQKSIFYITIISLILNLNIISPQPRHLISSISLKENLNISNYLSKYIELSGYSDSRRIEESRLSEYDYKLNYDLDSFNMIVFPKTVGSYLESLEFYVDSIQFNSQDLKIMQDYNYTITYPEDLITSYPKPLKFYDEKNNQSNYHLDFNLYQPDISALFKTKEIQELKDSVSVNNLIIGIDKNKKLKAFSFIQENINTMSFDKLFDEAGKKINLSGMEFTKILIDSNLDKKRRNILLIDTQNYVYIFKVEQTSNNFVNENPKTILSLKSFYNDTNIVSNYLVDFVEKKGIYYLAYSDEIVLRDASRKINTLKIKTPNAPVEKVDFKIIDLHEVGNAIYVLIENYGLRSLDISNPENVHWNDFDFFHPHIQKIDAYYNPYFDYPFLALLINNRHLENGSEFYIEFSLKDEFQPLVYRHYLSDKYLDIKYIVSDEEFSYLFEQNSNSIFVFSRSITATSRNSVFKIQLSELSNREVSSAPFIFYDETFVHRHLGILAGNRLIFTEKVELGAAELEIHFKKEGSYNLQFYTFSDFCNLPKEEVKMCKIYVNYNINVTKPLITQIVSTSAVTIIILIIITILLVVLISLVVFKFDKLRKWIKNKSYVDFYQNGEVSNNYDRAVTHRNTTDKDTQQEVVMTNITKP
jgi:hypothetical protein